MEQRETFFTTHVDHAKALELYDALVKAGVLSLLGCTLLLPTKSNQQQFILCAEGEYYSRELTSLICGCLEDWKWTADTEHDSNYFTIGYHRGLSQSLNLANPGDKGAIPSVLSAWFESDLSRTNNERYCVVVMGAYYSTPSFGILCKYHNDELLPASCMDGLLRHWNWGSEDLSLLGIREMP